MTKAEKIKSFDPNSIGDTTAGMFGLPFSLDECETVLIPVPWEVTVSYGGGTANGPKAIHEASYQVDLYDPNLKDAWKLGIGMDKENKTIRTKSKALRKKAEAIIDAMAAGKDVAKNKVHQKSAKEIQEGCLWLNKTVKERVTHYLNQKKLLV